VHDKTIRRRRALLALLLALWRYRPVTATVLYRSPDAWYSKIGIEAGSAAACASRIP
jgi:cell shape-determining protein MreC